MINIGGFLASKYAILGEHADAALASAQAANRQAGVQESLVPSIAGRNAAEGSAALGNAGAANTSALAQATSAAGRAGLENAQAGQIPADSAARRANLGADTAPGCLRELLLFSRHRQRTRPSCDAG
jgi:hypothetical protein